MHVHVGHAGNPIDLFRDAPSESVVGRAILSDKLDVDGRRQTEIENLADDIRGLEKKREIGILLWKLAAQLPDVVEGGSSPLRFERNQNLAIRGPDRRRIAERQINAAQRQT